MIFTKKIIPFTLENMKNLQNKNDILHTLLIPIIFALPLLYNPLYKLTTFMYITIFNGNIFRLFNPTDIQPEFYANSVWECANIVFISIYALIVRLICDIDTNLKKVLFALSFVAYLLPHQAMLVSICITILASNDIIEWNILKSWTAISYISTLVMSMCTYRVIVSRKNNKLKINLVSFTNLLLLVASVLPFVTEYNQYLIYTSFAIVFVWIATIADITFEGFGYKIIEKLITRNIKTV